MKLFNKGNRFIHTSGGVFAPQQTLGFDKEEGSRLMKLYPNEIVDINAVSSSNDTLTELQKEIDALRAENETLKASRPGRKPKAKDDGEKEADQGQDYTK